MIVCLLTVTLLTAMPAQSGRDEPPPVTWETLEARVAWEVERGFTGVVLVARGGKVVLHRAYGEANREKQIPMKPDTILGIGSTPIDFTKVGILLLAERGKLTVDDPITKFFDKVPADKQAMTLRHLMTGRSGLPDFHDVSSDRDKDHSWIDRYEAVRRILGQKLHFAPGQGRRHSHSGFGLLAAVIEIVSKSTYQDFTREHLFKPSGMTDTGFFGEKYAEDRMAVGYGSRKDGEVNAPPYWGKTSWLVMGSGGQVSTALDMWRWAQAVHGGKLISPESLKLYGGPGMLVGGDMYGFEIMYAGNQDAFMVIMSNTGSRRTVPALRKFGQSLEGLVAQRPAASNVPKYTLGIMLAFEDNGRLIVEGLTPGGAAERQGVRVADLITAFNDKPVGDEPMKLLEAALHRGESVKLRLVREGKQLEVTVKPEAR